MFQRILFHGLQIIISEDVVISVKFPKRQSKKGNRFLHAASSPFFFETPPVGKKRLFTRKTQRLSSEKPTNRNPVEQNSVATP